jgi:putative membrane protein
MSSPAPVTPSPTSRRLWVVLIIVLVVQWWLGWAPKTDRTTWALENFPTWIGIGLLVAYWRSVRLTPLLLGLLVGHSIILAVGGHWSYAEVPLGHWVKEWLGLARNHYDRLGHVAQGFVPALLVREWLCRDNVVQGRRWLAVLSGSVAVAFSAVYELLEWASAVLLGQGADSFLGTQGDVWDTQADMGLALLGATLSLTFLSRLHDRQLISTASVGVSGQQMRPQVGV